MPATLSRNLELILGARDKLTGPLRKMQAGFDRFKTYAAGAVKVVAAALAAATTAAVAFGKASVDAFAAFDTSMRDTWTLLKIGQDEFAALGDSIIDMTKRVPQSPQQLGSAIYDIISAGVGDTSEALIVLEQSALAATAGVTTTKDAAGAAVGIMNAFGKTTADIPEIFDLLFQTVNKGVVTFSELGPAASRTAASFQGAGASIQDMLGAMAFMTKTVGNANESSTKLRATMRALTKSAPELKKELGTAVFDAAGNFRGLKDVVGDLTKSLAGLTKEDQLTKIRKLFPEQEAQDAIVAMVNNYDLLASTLDDVADSQGAMNAAAEKQMGSWNNQMQIMKNAFTGIKTALGEVITAIAGPELQGFTAWLQGIQDELVRNKAAIIAYARTILPVLGSAFNTVADVVKQAFGIAWDIVKDFFMGLRHSPRQALIILGGIISAIPGLFWDVFKRALGVVGEVAKVIFTPLQGAFVFILDNIRFQIQDKLQGNLIEFLNWLISKANWVREKLGQEPWELFEKPPAAEAALTFEETWATSIQQLSERFASLGQESKDAIVKTVDDVAAVFTEIAGIMKNEMVSPAMETKLRELQNTLAAIPGTLQQGYEDAAAAATAAGAKAETALAKVKAAREAAAAPPPAPGAGGGTGGGDADKQAKSFGEVFGGAFGMALGFAGGNAIASLVGMLFSAINEGDVGGFVDNMIDGALTLIDGLVQGIPDFIVALVERMPELIGALIAAIPQLIYELIMHIPEILKALGRGLVNLFQIGGRTIALAFVTLVEKLIGGLLRFLGIELRDDIERLQNEINEMTEALGRAEAPQPAPAGGGMTGTAQDFARTGAPVGGGQQPVIIYNLEFSQPFVMSDQHSMDQLARYLAEADYRQSRRSSGSTGG